MSADPRKISFLDNVCDSCGQTDRQCKLGVLNPTGDGSSNVGWVICSEAHCKNRYEEWKTAHIRDIDSLIALHGLSIAIRRSSGLIEKGWSFASDAYQEGGADSDWWVKVSNGQGLAKHVTLEMISEWQRT